MIRSVLRHVVRLAAVTLAVAAAGVVAPSAAQASTCSTASGVSVVVDFHELGGGVQTYCDASGAGKYADAQFADAGHTLTYVQNEPFVCEVDGAPSTQCAHTPPADAYWSVWWSDGKSGKWSYSSTGVASLKVPAGAYVALSWQGSAAQAPPRATPRAHSSPPPSSSPTTSPPTSHPTTAPTSHPTRGPTAGTSATSSAPTGVPTSGTTKQPRNGHHQAHGTAHHSRNGPTSTQADPAPQRAATDSGSGSGSSLPRWVAPSIVALLFAGAAAVAVVRRKRTGGA